MGRADRDGTSPRERVGREAAVEQLGHEPPEVVAVVERGQVAGCRERHGTDASEVMNG